MSEWECGDNRCPQKVIGVGGAIGLTAIGWQFERSTAITGPIIRCPQHRTDVPDRIREGCLITNCHSCSVKWATETAENVQKILRHMHGGATTVILA